MAGLVGFVGSRGWSGAGALVSGLVSSVLRSGRGLAVGCAVGADRAVLSAALAAGGAASVSVFAAFGASGLGASASLSSVCGVRAAARAGAAVAWSPLAGAGVPFAGRCAARARALVSAVAASGPGAGLVGLVAAPCPAGLVPSSSPSRCWSGSGSGSWAALAFAAGLGIPVLVVPSCGSSALLPAWPGGSWVRASSSLSSPWFSAWRWEIPPGTGL